MDSKNTNHEDINKYSYIDDRMTADESRTGIIVILCFLAFFAYGAYFCLFFFLKKVTEPLLIGLQLT